MIVYPTGDPIEAGDVVLMYRGSLADLGTRYPGWQLCDGTNGTPDLRDKFILGISAGENPGDNPGGSHATTLGVANLPAANVGAGSSHTHGNTGAGSSHNHTQNSHNHTQNSHYHQLYGQTSNASSGSSYTVTRPTSGNANYNSPAATATNQAATATNNAEAAHTHPTGAEAAHVHPLGGSATPIDNRPAFYKLAYIAKIAA